MTHRTYGHNSQFSDESSTSQSYRLDGASARILDQNMATGEFLFEICADGRTFQFRCNQETVANNWGNWVLACRSEKSFSEAVKQFLPEEAKEDAEEVLNDPSALEKKIAIEIVKSLLSSYYEIVRRKLVDTIPKVGGLGRVRDRRSCSCW